MNNNFYSIKENTIGYTEPQNTLFRVAKATIANKTFADTTVANAGQWPRPYERNGFNWLSQGWKIVLLLGAELKHFNTSFISCSLLWFALTLLIFFRITQSNHFPLANFYEALIFLTWCLVTLNFIILVEPTGKKRPGNSPIPRRENSTRSPKKVSAWLAFSQAPNVSHLTKQWGERWWGSFYEEPSVQKQVSGAILAPCILFILAFAQFHLSSDVTPLVPALKSNWLLMHVSIMICSYTTFIIGGLLSVILLTQTLFSGSITLFRSAEGKPFNKNMNLSWSRLRDDGGNKRLLMNYPWLEKNTLKVEWPSLSQLSYGNHEMRLENPFLKIPAGADQMDFSEKFSRVFHIKNFNAFNQKRVSDLEDSLKQKDSPQGRNHDFSIGLRGSALNERDWTPSFRFPTYKSPPPEPRPQGGLLSAGEDLGSDEINSISNSLWQPNFSLSGRNWGFPSFEYVLEGPYKMQKKNFYIILDNLSYRMIGMGFPLFTLGILSGAVWANEAWGSYWSWDIKEVGSFINWLLVALYFHCRYKNFISLSHIVSFISLLVLFFNFFGISLGIFGSSLHAYGASA